MKTRTQSILWSGAIAAVAASILGASTARAATYYWDTNGSTAGYGTASGTWTAPTVSLWSTSNAGTAVPGPSITTTTTDVLNFGNGGTGLGAGTITVTGAVNSANMTFASGSGAIVLSSGGTITFGANNTITTNNTSNTIDADIAGAATALTKAGTGTLLLTGSNTYAGSTILSAGTLIISGTHSGTGATTINAGTLDLGNGGTSGSLASTVLTLGGGVFNYTRSDSATQGFTTTNINAGVPNVITVAAGNTLDLGTVTRGTGVFLDFSTTGAGTVAALASSNVGGIMPGFTVGDSWAVANGAGVAISGLGSYTLSSVAGTTGANYDGNNIDVDSSPGVLDAAITTNSLRFSSAAANTLTLTGTNVITTGGVLVGSGVGANLSTITGGTLAGAASKDLSVIQNNTSGGLTISSVIANNGGATALSKSGAGLLTLGGSNTFTGGLVINGGTVALGDAGALNSTASSENAVTFGPNSTGTLTLGGNSVIVRSLATYTALPGSAIVENANASAATLTVGNSVNASGTFGGVIQDGTGGGALALAKAGPGTFTLSGTNTYSGGTTINAGILSISSDANLGASTGGVAFNGTSTFNMNAAITFDASRTFTINGGAAATFNGNNALKTIQGQVIGSGTITFSATTGLHLTNSNNTFTGTITTGTAGNTGYGFGMASISDVSGVGGINLGIGTSGGTFRWLGASGVTQTLANRQFALSGTTGTSVISALGDTAADNLVINQNLLITGTGAKTLTLAGANTGANTFAGNIADGVGSVITVAKTEGGTWALGGTNTYTGITDLLASGTTGRLIFQGAQSLSSSTTIAFTQNSSPVQSISLLDDSVGTIDFARPITFGGANTTQRMDIFVGNNNTANGGSSSGTTTGSTIQVGDITWNNATQAGNTTRTFNVTGANGYRLETGNFILPNLSTRTAGQNFTNAFNPTTAPLTIGGTITMASGNNVSGGIPILNLAGTAVGNEVVGAISDAADVGTTLRPVNLTKTSTSTWTLSGNNTYTGTTTISGGTLLINGDSSAATGAVTVSGNGTTLGGDGIIGGAVTFTTGTSFLSPGNSPGQLTMPSLALGAATTTTMELGGTTLGTLYDNITINMDGALGYAGFLDVVNFGAFDMDVGSFTYDLFSFSGTTSPTGNFGSVTVNSIGLTNDGFGVWTASNGPSVDYTFTQSTGDLIVSVVPEPGTLALLAAGSLLGLGILRRRRKAA